MRTPIPGVLPPLIAARLTPSPPITPAETALLFSRNGEAEQKAIKLQPDGDSVILTNLTDTYAPYLLVIIDREAHTTWGRLYQHVRSYLEKAKENQ